MPTQRARKPGYLSFDSQSLLAEGGSQGHCILVFSPAPHRLGVTGACRAAVSVFTETVTAEGT